MGADVFHVHIAAEINIAVSIDVTFVEAKKTFIVGVVPVNLSVGIGGGIGIGLLGTAGLGGISLTPEPFAYVGVAGAVTVGIDEILEVGLEINLILLQLSVPIKIDLILPTFERLDWAVDIDFKIQTLSGYVAIIAKVAFVKFSLVIFSWSGFDWSYDIYDEAGSIEF
jgi:hypothetical protein